MNSLVSVIIPVYNGSQYIREAIQSILKQNFHNFEIIVVDDESDDYNYKLLENIDPRIKTIVKPRGGAAAARNTGMKLARGDYIAFLDADDVWFPGKLQAQMEYFRHNNHIGVVFGKFIRWTENKNGDFPEAHTLWNDCSHLTNKDTERSGWLYTRLLMGLLVGMNTAVIHRKIYDQIGGFNETMPIGEDYDFWIRASRVTEMHSLNGPVALYRIHSNSTMHKIQNKNHMVRLLECSKTRWGLQNPDLTCITQEQFLFQIAKSHFDHGYAHYWYGNRQVAIKSFSNALKGGYKRLRAIAYILLATLPKIKNTRPDKHLF